MRIFAQDRKRLCALLPAVGLMLFTSAAWAGDNPGPTLPNNPAVPGAPATPGAPDMSEGPLRHTEIPAAPKAEPAPAIPGIPKAAEAPWMPRY